MPPLPPVSGTLKIELVWRVESDPKAATIFHLAYTGGPPTSANCASMADSILADAVARFASLLQGDSSLASVTVLDLSSDMGGEGSSTGGDAEGTRAGSELAPGTSVVVSKKVARHYRGGHPRSYLPLGAGGDINAGMWYSGFQDTCAAAWSDFIGDCTADGVGCVITGEISVSYFSGGVPRVTPHKDPIVSYAGNILVGSQRRRNRKQ
jgi:hypothetical protein